MKKYILLFAFLGFSSYAQTGIGILVPDESAVLDVTSSNKGVLLSRISLKSSRDLTVITSPANSLMVFNTATINDVTPGYYYWKEINKKWTRVLDSDSPAWTWGMFGNEAADHSYIGTNNRGPLVFKTNNIESGRLSDDDYNTSFGVRSLLNRSNRGYNTAIGFSSLEKNTGASNTAVGYHALPYNISGSSNIAIGPHALQDNISGSYNISFGVGSVAANTTGSYNIGIGTGTGALLNITDDSEGFNTFIGSKTGQGIISGKNNTILGSRVSSLSATLSNNIIIADGSGNRRINVDDKGNIGLGTNTPHVAAALDITSTNKGLLLPRVELTAINVSTPLSDVTAGMLVYNTVTAGTYHNKVIPGQYYHNGEHWVRLMDVTSGWSLTGNSNTSSETNFIGTTDNVDLVFRRNNSIAGKITVFSTALGVDALNNDLAANSINTAIGSGVLANTTVGYNTGIGYLALNKNTIGFDNVATGYFALHNNLDGEKNVANGNSALLSNTNGKCNVALGYNSLIHNITGSGNTAIGYNAGPVSGNLTTGLNNTIAIGNEAKVSTSNEIRFGNSEICIISTQVALSTSSDKRYKDNIKTIPLGLDFLNNLRPVEYIRKNSELKTKEWGIIASELLQTLQKLNYEGAGIVQEDSSADKMLSVRYTDLIAPIIKALQELSERTLKLETQNDLLKTQNDLLEKRIGAMLGR